MFYKFVSVTCSIAVCKGTDYLRYMQVFIDKNVLFLHIVHNIAYIFLSIHTIAHRSSHHGIPRDTHIDASNQHLLITCRNYSR